MKASSASSAQSKRPGDGLSAADYDKILDMSTTEFNRHLKMSNISQDEIVDLRKARRRKKNRLYAKRSRGKKHTKLLELQATVSQLAAAAASGSGSSALALQAARRAVAEYVAEDEDDEDEEDERGAEGLGGRSVTLSAVVDHEMTAPADHTAESATATAC